MIRDDHEQKLNELGFPWNFEVPQKTVKSYMEEPQHVLSANMTAKAAMEYFVDHNIAQAAVVTKSVAKPDLKIFAGILNANDFWSAHHSSHKNQAATMISLPNKSGDGAAFSMEQAAKAIHQEDDPLLVDQIMSTKNCLVLNSEMQMSSVAALLQPFTHIREVPVIHAPTGELQGVLKVQHCLQDLLFVMRNLPANGVKRLPHANSKRGTQNKRQKTNDHQHGAHSLSKGAPNSNGHSDDLET